MSNSNKKIKWEVRRWTRNWRTVKVGFVFAVDYQEAKAIAWKKWPSIGPTDQQPFGIQKIDPVECGLRTKSHPEFSNSIQLTEGAFRFLKHEAKK